MLFINKCNKEWEDFHKGPTTKLHIVSHRYCFTSPECHGKCFKVREYVEPAFSLKTPQSNYGVVMGWFCGLVSRRTE